MIPRLKGERNRDRESESERRERYPDKKGWRGVREGERESWTECEEGKQKQREIDLESHSVGEYQTLWAITLQIQPGA